MYKHIILSVILSFGTFGAAKAQELRSPVDIPIYLSGSFGELRSNHFHSGIDIKTQGVTGKTVHAVQDGYVSRLSVSPYGFGLAVYLNHPDSTTTVYGHLLKFNDKIAAYVKQQQYKEESFRVDLALTPDLFPVKKGDIIALSGNSGSSGGPHVHFEVRNTLTEEPLDPQQYYISEIKDSKPPRIQSVMVYPMKGKGAVNNSQDKKAFSIVTDKSGKQTLSGKIEAWGEIGFALKAYDYMDETSNNYGVKEITLQEGNTVLFHSNLNQFAFGETRYINSFTDYEEWKEKRSFYMKSFIEPGNRLRFMEATDRGILTINEPHTYQLTYHLADAHGNTTTLTFGITGREQEIAAPDTSGTEHFPYYTDNRFGAKGIRLTIPRGNLYTDLNFRYTATCNPTAYAATHQLHNHPLAFHTNAQLSLRIQNDTYPVTSAYGIVRIVNGQQAWIGGKYRDGWLDANIRELGDYTVGVDSIPPHIAPISTPQWIKNRTFKFRITDNLSGIEKYTAYIDGKFALFEMDGKTAIITHRFNPKELTAGKHTLELRVTDGSGNETMYMHTFVL